MMTLSLLNFMFLLFLTPMIAILLSYSHLLMILLYLELITLASLLSFIFMISLSSSLDPINLFIILTLGACEASMGLSCLVIMTRTYGSDNVKALTPLTT